MITLSRQVGLWLDHAAAGTAKPLVSEGLPHHFTATRGFFMLFYRAALPLSPQTLTFTAGVIRRHLKAIGSRWRKLNPGQQALLVLAYLRKGETFDELAAGFGVGRTTAWRYVNETVELLAARAPKLRQAVRDAKRAGYAYVILDGTLIPIDRVAADRPFYSGKHKQPRDEPAGHRQPRRRHPVGLRRAARLGPRQEGRVGATRGRTCCERTRRLEGRSMTRCRRRSSRLVLRACPCPGVRARVLPARVRSPGKSLRAPVSSGGGGRGEGRAGESREPSLMSRYRAAPDR